MRKILITYGDNNFELSKKRIRKEAQSLGCFDYIKTYGPDDLPAYIKSSPLMAYSRGGGYWVWKPYLIWRTLNEYQDSIVVYVDAGCSLQPSADWNYWFSIMETTDTIVFQYRNDYDYGWEAIGFPMDTRIVRWTKPLTRSFFDSVLESSEWRVKDKILSGCILAKNNSVVIKSWFDATLFHPELIIDSFLYEKHLLPKDFIVHRHDQILLALFAFLYEKDNRIVKILPETCESDSNAGVVASRIKDSDILNAEPKISNKTKIIRFIKLIIGEHFYNTLHDIIK